MRTADDFISEILEETRKMSDIEYCDFLEEIAIGLTEFADVKRSEMNDDEI